MADQVQPRQGRYRNLRRVFNTSSYQQTTWKRKEEEFWLPVIALHLHLKANNHPPREESKNASFTSDWPRDRENGTARVVVTRQVVEWLAVVCAREKDGTEGCTGSIEVASIAWERVKASVRLDFVSEDER